MVVAAALLILILGTSWLLTIFQGFAERLPILAPLLQPGWVVAGRLVGFLFTMSLFYALYRFCPARILHRGSLLLATLVGAGLFELSKLAFTWYVVFAQANVALYGALGGFIFFFLWLYYGSTVFIVGAEVGWSYEQASTKAVYSGNH
jgi:YihY family inner membrane protein